MDTIQADLDMMKSTWNSHHIRANKVHVNGIPITYLNIGVIIFYSREIRSLIKPL